jgi:hypothetical protein
MIGVVLTLCGLVACANQATVENSNEGTEKLFNHPYDEVGPAVLETLQGLNVNIKKNVTDGSGAQIIFTKSVSAWSWGEVGSVRVKPVGEDVTLVVVDTEKRSQLQVTGTDEEEFSNAIFSGVGEILDRMK